MIPYRPVSLNVYRSCFISFLYCQLKKEKIKDTFSAAFRAIYFATLHVEEIGEKYFEDVLYLLIKGLVNQIV